jgi:tRNA-2-methylthio-N6-dimethylallyladenosine synthase
MAATVDAEVPNPKRQKPQKPWPTLIQETLDKQTVQAFRVRHIVVANDELANMTRQDIQKGIDFSALAGMVSDCQETRESGGEVGWVTLDDKHEAVGALLPRAAREEIWNHKPGDVFCAESERGVHVIHIEDVMMSLSTSKQKRGRMPGAESKPGFIGEDGMPVKEPTYHVMTMGCQMNVADSERMSGVLDDLGYKETQDKDAASLLVINTCTIRDHAEQKVYSALGKHAVRKRKGEDVGIVVAGCVAQQEGAKLLRRVPEVDLVMGPQYVNRLGDLLEEVGSGAQVVATDPSLISEDISKPKRGSAIQAWVNVIYGCNEHCTYCVVPGVRGVEQSRPKESIRKEIEELAAAGYREITLLGQNIDAYGRDMNPRTTFADLLHYVGDVPGIERMKFVTSHPRYMSERVVDAVATIPALSEVFYVPFQSGDDEVLRRMRRGYSVATYMRIIDRIKRLVPDAAICGDVIVGFPGETDDQFDRTLDLIRNVGFDSLNAYAYSPRPNTEAALWEEQVPEDVKSDRLQKVMRLGMQVAQKRSNRYMGRVMDILVEDVNMKQPNQVTGRNRQNRPVFFEGDIEQLKGKLVPVRITECRPYSLSGMQEGEPY